VAVRREFSAGGVVLRRLRGEWHVAAIKPGGRRVWALPKGIVDGDEGPATTARREVLEETGVDARVVEKLGDIRYAYMFRGERVFKIVSFYLMRYSRGRLGNVAPGHRHEVDAVQWVPLADAPKMLAYGGERDMVKRAQERIAALEPL